jgi:tetratricopeptide (TPR) repeat protein
MMRSRRFGSILAAAGLLVVIGLVPAVRADLSDARGDIAAMRYTEAENALREIAKDSEGNDKLEALFYLAGLKRSAPEAEIIYREIARLDQSGRWGAAASVELAKIRFAVGEYGEASNILESSLACRKSEAACYFAGLSDVILKRYDAAREPLARVKSDRLRPWAEIALAEADAGLENPSGACRRYQGLIGSSVAATAKYRYGECLEKEGDVRGARKIYEEVRAEYTQTPESILAGEKLEALRAEVTAKPREEASPPTGAGQDETPLTAGFTLQFGSFGDRANAIKLAAELKGKIAGIRIDSDLVNFREVHRVRSGYFKTRAEAERRAEDIARQTGENCAIMPLP